MNTVNLKSLLMLVGLTLLNAPAWAYLKTDNSIIDNDSSKAVITVGFPAAMHGDLYIATPLNGQLYFFSNNGVNFSTDVAAFTKNADFAEDRVALTISNAGIPAGTYTFYQIVVVAGKDPLNFTNWIGGIGGLSELKISINLPVISTASTATPTPTPTVIPTPIPAIAPTAIPTAIPMVTPTALPTVTTVLPDDKCTALNVKSLREKSDDNDDNEDECRPTLTPTLTPTLPPIPVVTLDGKSLYTINCSNRCHGSNPKADSNHILRGKDAGTIREAIQKNKGGEMGILKDRINDAAIDAIAAYLRTF